MSARITANRPEVSSTFRVAGFTVRTGLSPSWFEVALATDPELFWEGKARRNHTNFYSSRVAGPLPAVRGDAVYLVPPAVLARFAGKPKLYYVMATYRQADFRNPEVVRLPSATIPSIQLSKSFTSNLRGLTGVPNPAGGLTGNGNRYVNGNPAALEWGGDTAAPGEVVAVTAPTNDARRNGTGSTHDATQPVATQSGSAIAYDDGFDPQLWSRTAAVGADDEHYGIEAPIPDNSASSDAQSYSRSLSAPEYPQASRFEPAAASNYRTSTAPRTINRIVVHITDGGANISGPISWFQNPSAKVSAHYIVGEDGEVVQMVPHNDVAWHARSANGDSIGIEHVANTRGLNPTEAQYCASAALVCWLAEQYNILIDRTHILGHSEADPNTSHTGCPNRVWNWDYFMGMVTSGTCYPMSTTSAQALGARPARALSSEIPLDPGNGGQSIGLDALAVGDIIVSTTHHIPSHLIRFGSGAPVSHAMLYTGDGGQVVEAIGEGIVFRPLAEAIADATVAVAFRHPDVTAEQAWQLRDFVGQQIGRLYNYMGIVRQALFQIDRATVCRFLSGPAYDRCVNFVGRVNLGTATNDTFFCSELVLAAYQAAGVPLTDSPPNWGSPGDLAELRLSGLLNYVGHLKAPPLTTSQGVAAANVGRYGGSGPAPQNGNGVPVAKQGQLAAMHPMSEQRVRAFSGQSFDVNWSDMQLVPQMTGMSCWAAAAAMIIGWRDQISIDPAEVARGSGHWEAYAHGLYPANHRDLAQAWGLAMEPPQDYSIEGFRQLLEDNGPLWVGVAVPSGHAVVVTGLYGDGTVDGTAVRVNDPWPPGQGSQYDKGLRQFMQEYDNRMTVDPAGNVNIQILHANGRRPLSAAQSYASSLAWAPALDEDIERMRTEFVANVAAGSPSSCIVITNAGLRQFYGTRLHHPDGTNKRLGSTIHDTMAALQSYGLAQPETIFEFNDAAGRLTRGVNRPEALRNSVAGWLLSEAEMQAMSAWYVFGLSVMDGYHSVILALAFSGNSNPDTRIFWADQVYSGWDDVTGSLDTRITSLTQRWWDPLPANRKARTRVTLWPLLPGNTLVATTQSRASLSGRGSSLEMA